MNTIDRREFFRRVVLLGGSAALAPSLVGLAACGDSGRAYASVRRAGKGQGGYGALVTSPDCPELSIPEGFRCVKLSETLAPSRANRGFVSPPAFDGMGAFPLPNGNIRLIRNHEVSDDSSVARPIGPNAYDPKAGGGTTSLEVHVAGEGVGRRVELLAEYVSLSGTHRNCAGGLTPWGSWLSCEETVEGAIHGREREHGYIFEVPVAATAPVDPVPLKAMGRFSHEAIAVDPATGFIYETEDVVYDPDPDAGQLGSGFYRFLPERPGDLQAGGRLQMLAVVGHPRYNTTTAQRPGVVLPVEWVDIDDPDPANTSRDPSAVFRQGLARGGAIFQRLEGCWGGDGSIFFNATSGGDAEAGQVWQYRPAGTREAQLQSSGGQLILVFESPSRTVLDSPDNLCVSPRGGLLICEDTKRKQYIRGITPGGAIFDLVMTNGRRHDEFCGATFAPGGDVVFFNIYGKTAPGGTYALWGPWEQGAL